MRSAKSTLLATSTPKSSRWCRSGVSAKTRTGSRMVWYHG
nr:MAG TPA: hypothetical protein [Caudoviricetes sp.]